MGRLSRIAVHPIKSLDQHVRDEATITAHGGLADDRRYAILDGDGELVNGKRTAAVHRIRASLDEAAGTLSLETNDGGSRETFDLPADLGDAEGWLSDYFGFDVALRRTDGPAMTDIDDPGPTVIAAATIETVASWFPGVDVDGMTRRLRPNLVVDGVEPFWEDRLAIGGTVGIGGVELTGVTSVPRCVVPTRDPDTGEVYEGFRGTFIRNRKATFPDWADPADFPGYFSLMAATHAPEDSRGRALSVGDPVDLLAANP